jgi:uncharacterized protein (TIGR03086 family)
MDLLSALSQTFDHTHGVIAGVRADQMGNATPCTEWDVQALLGHALGVVAGIGGAVRGDPPPADGAAFVLADDAAAQFRSLADSTLAAWTKADLTSEINIGAGPMPGSDALSINLLDTSTHAWDVARATGQPADLPEELAALVLGICQGFVTDEIRGFAGFSPAVAVSDAASSTTKLVAFLGRTP